LPTNKAILLITVRYKNNMGACHSQPSNGDNIDNQQDKARLNDPGNTNPVEYQSQPVVHPNQDTGLANGEVISAPSNVNPAHPGEAVATEVVYQDPQPRVSNEVVYQNIGPSWATVPGNLVYNAETDPAFAGHYVEPRTVEVGNYINAHDYQMATVSTNTVPRNLQNSGYVQDSGVVSMETVVQSSKDVQGGEGYDPMIEGMKYKNNSVHGLEAITTTNVNQAEPVVVSNVGYQESEFKNIEYGIDGSGSANHIMAGNEMQFDATTRADPIYQSASYVSTNAIPRVGDQHDGTEIFTMAANQGTLKTVGQLVYDPMIGGMVNILDPEASVDGLELIEVNASS